VTVEGPLDENGVVMDFADLGEVVRRAILEQFDHRYLNEDYDNPTAEVLAVSFAKLLEGEGLPIAKLTLWETPSSRVTVRGST
jgi:6-pyruvoyltetrahydropterin/6-carboxytetrahydropterin synthase